MEHDRFRTRRLLVVGSGDVALRALPWLRRRFRVFALCRSPQAASLWRAAGAVPVLGDLDHPDSLRRLRGLAELVLHFAPPHPEADGDPRTVRLLAALNAAGIIPRRMVYISTTGVYGDCAGARVSETRATAASTARGRRRVAAERHLRDWVRRRARSGSGSPGLVILRAPGIYAADRLPLARLRAGTPALNAAEDGYTSHIHADDLAHAACLSLFRLRGGRSVNVADDSELRMGEWFDAVAAAFGLAPPRRISRAQAEAELPESLLGFMRESRRLDNRRLKRESGVRLRYPTVAEGLAAAREHQGVFEAGADRSGRRREQ
jgi:nucleoside-diphosphate-sugar epimerase